MNQQQKKPPISKMKKLKNRIIRRLGGIVFEDLSLPLQVDVLQELTMKALDANVSARLENGFSTKT